jgi:hypothetical protein
MATKRAKKTDVVSPSSAELRKAVEAIAIQPKSGKITLLTRKLFNVLLAVAQQADESGDTYRALLSDIVANSAFSKIRLPGACGSNSRLRRRSRRSCSTPCSTRV